ncbi:thiolase family protein [Nocardioides halotolerans]|uniref:thiolase family protein n=1 Tax=Nocardioides halotolerans TaxID=433660 RepID=UPI0004280B3A|nr:thiolase family protein [Nocardioides halotolerans]
MTAGILGIGEVVRPPQGTSSMELHAMAARKALADAGLTIRDIDGLVVGYSLTEPKMVLSAAVAEYLGLDVRYLDSAHVGGAAPFFGVASAAAAIAAGRAERVLVIFGDNRKTGWASMDAAIAAMIAEVGHPEYELPYGPLIPANLALIARRHFHEFGTTREQLAMIPVMQREHARLKEGAERTDPLSVQDILDARPVATPLVAADCALVSDSAGALVVGHLDDDVAGTEKPRVAIRGTGGWSDYYYPFQSRDLTTFGFKPAARQAFEQAGLGPEDMDLAEIYDAFSVIVLVALEDIGFCSRGTAGEFVAERRTALGGQIPVNTHGGLLSFSGNGTFHITEAVSQLRHDAGERQVENARRAFVTGIGGMLAVHYSLVLERAEP